MPGSSGQTTADRLGLQDVVRVRGERAGDADAVAEEAVAVRVLRVGRRRSRRWRPSASPVDRGDQGLGADGDRAHADDLDVLVVDHLLAAGLTLLLGRRGEAREQLDGLTADAAQLLVEVLDRELGALGRARADVGRAALLVHPADGDRALLCQQRPPSRRRTRRSRDAGADGRVAALGGLLRLSCLVSTSSRHRPTAPPPPSSSSPHAATPTASTALSSSADHRRLCMMSNTLLPPPSSSARTPTGRLRPVGG